MSTPTIGVNNPYPGVIPLSKDYRKLQAGSLAKKQEQLVVDKSDGDNPPSLAERVALIEVDGLGWTRAKNTLEQPSVSDKLVSIEDGIDDSYEQLSNKYISTPYIGTVHPGAKLLIPLSPSNYIKMWAQTFGAAGENITLEITQATDPSIDFSIAKDGYTLTAILGTDENGDPVPVTATEFKAAWEALDEFNAIARIQSIDASISEYSVEPMVETPLAVGDNPSVRLTASAQELNDTVAKAPASGAPTAPVAATSIATFSAEPSEGDTITIGTQTYRFRADVLGEAVAASGEWTDSTNTLAIASRATGFSGNDLSVNLIDPGVETASTTAALNVDGVTIDVTLSSSAVPAINATLADVKAAIEADTACDELVTCAITGAGTTVIDDTDITLDGGIDEEQPNDVFSGGTAEIAIDNLVTAITEGDTTGVVGKLTEVNTLATAVKKDADEMTCTALIAGVIGNTIAIGDSEDGSGSIVWDEELSLQGGVDGTAAPAGAIRFASGELWVSVEESTISESHWQKATLT